MATGKKRQVTLNDLTLLYEQMLGKYYLRMVTNEFLHRFAELGSS